MRSKVNGCAATTATASTLKLISICPTDLWEFPLETVSLSEEGFERTYQGTVLLAHSKITLQPGQVWVRSWRVGVQSGMNHA